LRTSRRRRRRLKTRAPHDQQRARNAPEQTHKRAADAIIDARKNVVLLSRRRPQPGFIRTQKKRFYKKGAQFLAILSKILSACAGFQLLSDEFVGCTSRVRFRFGGARHAL